MTSGAIQLLYGLSIGLCGRNVALNPHPGVRLSAH